MFEVFEFEPEATEETEKTLCVLCVLLLSSFLFIALVKSRAGEGKAEILKAEIGTASPLAMRLFKVSVFLAFQF